MISSTPYKYLSKDGEYKEVYSPDNPQEVQEYELPALEGFEKSMVTAVVATSTGNAYAYSFYCDLPVKQLIQRANFIAPTTPTNINNPGTTQKFLSLVLSIADSCVLTQLTAGNNSVVPVVKVLKESTGAFINSSTAANQIIFVNDSDATLDKARFTFTWGSQVAALLDLTKTAGTFTGDYIYALDTLTGVKEITPYGELRYIGAATDKTVGPTACLLGSNLSSNANPTYDSTNAVRAIIITGIKQKIKEVNK